MQGMINSRMRGKPITILDVLVVEDDKRIRQLYEEVLKIFGFRYVITAEDGAAAAELVKTRHFDLVICDWEMPYMTGAEFLTFVRTSFQSPNPQLPIIFVTGMAEREHVFQARDLGVTEFIAKPFSLDSLRDRIIKVFEHPRQFVKSAYYRGPCRRRRSQNEIPSQNERRRQAA